jgi:tetratricopeptide (TPR) repeat protein
MMQVTAWTQTMAEHRGRGALSDHGNGGGDVPERAVAADLLRNVFADPHAAAARARDLLTSTTDPVASSMARQVIGIVLRDHGEMAAALVELRKALRLARDAKDPMRVADVNATLGAALAMAGRTAQGLGHLDLAVQDSRGVALATVLTRRAWVFGMLGRHRAALADLRRAVRVFAGAGDVLWQARALNIRGSTQIRLGDLAGAEHDFIRAAELFASLGQELDVAFTVQNRGGVAFVAGDLPRAFARYAEAADAYDRLGEVLEELVVDRCRAYLAAGLAGEAVDVVETALRQPVQPRHRAELLLMRANAALAAGDVEKGALSADKARRMFRRQQRDWFEVRAQLTGLSARRASGRSGRALLAGAASLVERMRPLRVPEMPQALLLAGRLAAEVEPTSAPAYFAEAAAYRRSAVSTTRATGWLATALERRTRGDSRGVLRACASGLQALDEHQATLGSPELRALATRHGEELSALATREALAGGDPRRLLLWAERWRATALSQPPVTAARDDVAAADLAALRAHNRKLAEARATGETTEQLERQGAHLEQAIRHRRLQAVGAGGHRERFAVDTLLGALSDHGGHLVELIELDGELYAVVAGHGRVRRFRIGPVAEAVQALEFAHFTLRQAARGRPVRLDPVGERLERTLLGPVAGALRDGAVVLSPTSRFHAVPWGLVPSLAERPLTTAPSAGLWLRARSIVEPTDGDTVLVVGPGLASGGAEVPLLASQNPDAVSLGDGAATVDRTLDALDGARLVHLAAHGHFRHDSPMFSSIVLDDGPLVVHDFERLTRAPYRVVLSACESGVMKPVGADELLGLGAALLSLGTAGIVSSVAVVHDEATVAVMEALHQELRSGGGLAEALLAARVGAAHDPTLAATAASFTALGV